MSRAGEREPKAATNGYQDTTADLVKRSSFISRFRAGREGDSASWTESRPPIGPVGGERLGFRVVLPPGPELLEG